MVETVSDIVLIGPVRAGKSTIGKLLADALELPQISLDTARWGYYKEIGYDEDFAQEIRARGGFLALALYWNLFAAHAVERLLADHQNCVIDFGAGIYESAESFPVCNGPWPAIGTSSCCCHPRIRKSRSGF